MQASKHMHTLLTPGSVPALLPSAALRSSNRSSTRRTTQHTTTHRRSSTTTLRPPSLIAALSPEAPSAQEQAIHSVINAPQPAKVIYVLRGKEQSQSRVCAAWSLTSTSDTRGVLVRALSSVCAWMTHSLSLSTLTHPQLMIERTLHLRVLIRSLTLHCTTHTHSPLYPEKDPSQARTWRPSRRSSSHCRMDQTCAASRWQVCVCVRFSNPSLSKYRAHALLSTVRGATGCQTD